MLDPKESAASPGEHEILLSPLLVEARKMIDEIRETLTSAFENNIFIKLVKVNALIDAVEGLDPDSEELKDILFEMGDRIEKMIYDLSDLDTWINEYAIGHFSSIAFQDNVMERVIAFREIITKEQGELLSIAREEVDSVVNNPGQDFDPASVKAELIQLRERLQKAITVATVAIV